jgi:hypothetical protein
MQNSDRLATDWAKVGNNVRKTLENHGIKADDPFGILQEIDLNLTDDFFITTLSKIHKISTPHDTKILSAIEKYSKKNNIKLLLQSLYKDTFPKLYRELESLDFSASSLSLITICKAYGLDAEIRKNLLQSQSTENKKAHISHSIFSIVGCVHPEISSAKEIFPRGLLKDTPLVVHSIKSLREPSTLSALKTTVDRDKFCFYVIPVTNDGDQCGFSHWVAFVTTKNEHGHYTAEYFSASTLEHKKANADIKAILDGQDISIHQYQHEIKESKYSAEVTILFLFISLLKQRLEWKFPSESIQNIIDKLPENIINLFKKIAPDHKLHDVITELNKGQNPTQMVEEIISLDRDTLSRIQQENFQELFKEEDIHSVKEIIRMMLNDIPDSPHEKAGKVLLLLSFLSMATGQWVHVKLLKFGGAAVAALLSSYKILEPNGNKKKQCFDEVISPINQNRQATAKVSL